VTRSRGLYGPNEGPAYAFLLLAPGHEGLAQRTLSGGSFFHVQDRPRAIAVDEWDLDPGPFLEHREITAQFEIGGREADQAVSSGLPPFC
jgi:hypothetical protein